VSQEEHDQVLRDIGSSSRDIFGLPINCTFTEAQAVVDRVKLTVRALSTVPLPYVLPN
jgi:hypothetical protein